MKSRYRTHLLSFDSNLLSFESVLFNLLCVFESFFRMPAVNSVSDLVWKTWRKKNVQDQVQQFRCMHRYALLPCVIDKVYIVIVIYVAVCDCEQGC